VNCDLASRREAVVRSIVAADQGRIVGVVADTGTCHGVGISIYRSSGRQDQRRDGRDTHIGRLRSNSGNELLVLNKQEEEEWIKDKTHSMYMIPRTTYRNIGTQRNKVAIPTYSLNLNGGTGSSSMPK
jgi:hypothetical protein